LARVYRAAASEQPPAAVDARIRAAAHEAANTAKARGRGTGRWAVPFAIAATVVLSVGIVLRMSQQGAIEPEDAAFERTGTPEPAAPPTIADKKSEAISESASALRRETAPTEVSELGQREARIAADREAAEKIGPAREGSPPGARRKEVNAPAAAAAKAARPPLADVTRLQVSGSPGAYYFSVTIRSLDTGCAQYADWWEVVGADGKLLYRRVLLHSHVDEQPFERSGGPVSIQPDTTVWVRAHMNTSGYGGTAWRGSVKTGFAAATPPPGLAADAATQAPLPDGCAF
jgi:hypothetical protein